MPVSAISKRSRAASFRRDGRGATVTDTLPCSVNLIAFPTRLSRTWRSRVGSPQKPDRPTGSIASWRSIRFSRAFRPEQTDGGFDHLDQIEIDCLELDLPGFELGDVENVVDQGQQRLGAVMHGDRAVALFRVELGLQQQRVHPEDAVHRGADFVRHVGEEIGLGAARRLCCVPRRGKVRRHGGQVLAEPLKALLRRLEIADLSCQRGFRRLDFRDVGANPDDAAVAVRRSVALIQRPSLNC